MNQTLDSSRLNNCFILHESSFHRHAFPLHTICQPAGIVLILCSLSTDILRVLVSLCCFMFVSLLFVKDARIF